MTTSAKLKKSDSADEIGVYLLAAELLHLEIDSRLKTVLTESNTLAALQELDSECHAYLSKEWSDNCYEQAAVHYCSQFILNESESVPRAAGWMGLEDTMVIDKVVSKFITEWKIEVPPSYKQLAFDHISLVLYVSSVIRQQDPELAEEFDAAALYSWCGKLGNSLRESPVPVYRALGKILEQLGAK